MVLRNVGINTQRHISEDLDLNFGPNFEFSQWCTPSDACIIQTSQVPTTFMSALLMECR